MVNNPILEKLRKLIIARQTSNGNKCGTTVIFLTNELNIDANEVKKLLNELNAEKLIMVRQGINQKLIFLRR